jgi:hypothetical protein
MAMTIPHRKPAAHREPCTTGAWTMELARHLLAGPTASAALEAWCVRHGIGSGPLRADRHATSRPVPPEDDLLDALAPARGERLAHRQVTLVRGDLAVSDCDLWWLPARLPPALNVELAETQHPFGAVIAPLAPSRRTLFQALLRQGGTHVLELRAVVTVGSGARRPVAAVRELYRPILVTPWPAR